jgi:hypothetical protein
VINLFLIRPLETNFTLLERDLYARNDALRTDMSQVRAGAAQESDERRKADEILSEKLKQLAIGGLNLEAIGLAWLLLGTIGTSIPRAVVWVTRRLF